MESERQVKITEKLKKTLSILHQDWEQLLKQKRIATDPEFLKKIALDIQKLDEEATAASLVEGCKKRAKLIHFMLTTPWGAPFIGETTLIEAARSYSEETTNSSLQHLLTDFARYGNKKQSSLFKVFDEIYEELDSN